MQNSQNVCFLSFFLFSVLIIATMKKGRCRKTIIDGAIQHFYQRAKDKGVIFYDDLDRLVYYTTASVIARRYGVSVLAMSIMYTHLHQAIRIARREEMENYVRDTASSYARQYNARYSRKGDLFQHNYGSASKVGAKKIRETLAYICNNHVEKGICLSASEARWCFLPYIRSNHPFSEPLDHQHLSKAMKSAIRIVDRRRAKGVHLYYRDLNRVIGRLNDTEREQLTDHVIVKYMFLDFNTLISFYNSCDDMFRAFNVTTGHEYDIQEEYAAVPDTYYEEMLLYLARAGIDTRSIYRLSPERKDQIAHLLFLGTRARKYQIQKLLH